LPSSLASRAVCYASAERGAPRYAWPAADASRISIPPDQIRAAFKAGLADGIRQGYMAVAQHRGPVEGALAETERQIEAESLGARLRGEIAAEHARLLPSRRSPASWPRATCAITAAARLPGKARGAAAAPR
jgi:hypothetical protein